jgi:hypothetical protein
MTYSSDDDGRITSALKEKEYLTKLKTALGPQFKFEFAKSREWYDFKVDDIFIDLKITGQKGTDNAWNIKRLIFTWGGKQPPTCNLDMNQMYDILKGTPRIDVRDPLTELYYLVVDKNKGDILLKSIVDIKTYTPNAHPSNVMQIDWKNEWAYMDYVAPGRSAKMLELARVVQDSVRRSIRKRDVFANAEIV